MSDTLADIARVCASSLSLDEVLGPVLRLMAQSGLERATLTRRGRGDVLVLEAGHGLTPAELRRLQYRVGRGITGRVVETGAAESIPNVAEEPRFEDHLGIRQRYEKASFTCVPVRHDGDIVGALSAFRIGGHAPRDLARLEVVAGLLAAQVVRVGTAAPEPSPQPSNLIGRSKAMLGVYGLIGQVAPSPTTVLLRGESGTGKELVAQAVHAQSPRVGAPFVKVNCAALAEGVLESELFGHEKGAFTGAHTRRLGRFERAHGGTLFLDEIGDLSPQTQIKLLRVLQEREVERVGGDVAIEVDVRVVAATSRDLEAMMAEGAFRADLYYRLNVFPIRLPALRERRADIVLLADHFVEVCNRAHGRRVRRLASSAIDMLMSYHWPGNVRELENCIERAVLLARDDVVMGHHLPPSLQTAEATGTAPSGLKEALAGFERELVRDALKSTGGNIAAAARALGISERIMGLRVLRYGITARSYKNVG